MTMLLPTVFAACTSDEFESYENNSLSQRKELGQVTFNLSNGEAQTRWDGSFLPEVSDVFGAALVDNYIGENATEQDIADGKKWQLNYKITDYIQTNYPFTYNGSYWASEANLVEGNYVFYAPYSQNHQSRKPIQYQTPVAQTLTVENGKIVANSAMESVAKGEYPFYIAYQFLDAANDNRNISLEMRPIFAYPKFTFKNNKSEAVTITRILVQDENGAIVESGNFDNSKVVSNMRNTKDGAWGGSLETNMKGGLQTENLLGNVKKTNLVRADLTSAVTVAKGETAEFSIVLPAMTFAQGELTVYFVTESGKAYTYTNATSAITTVPGRRYPAEDYQLSGELKSSAGQLLTKTLESSDVLTDAPYIVTSKQELIDAINSTPASSTSLELTLAGEVDFDSEVLSTIAERLSQPVKFVGDINIIGGTESAPLNIDQKVIFDNATIESGNVKFNNNVLAYANVTVEEGAALSVDKIDNTATSTIINKGKLTLNCAVKDVENNSALVLGTNASYTSLTNAATSTTELSGNVTIQDATLNGTWNVPAGMTLTLGQATLPYGSKLTVAGTLSGTKLTVSGTAEVSGRSNVAIEVKGDATPANVKKAVLNLKKGAVLVGAVSGNSSGSNTDAQIVNIEDGVNFFANPSAIANTKATYTYADKVTKEGDINVPAQCNTVVLGGISASEDIDLDWSTTPAVTDVTVGEIMAANGAVTLTTAASGKVHVTGDILATKTVTIDNATELTVDGELNTSASFSAAAATDIILGKLTVKEGFTWTLTKAESLTVKGEIITNTDIALPATVEELYLYGDITITNAAKSMKLVDSRSTALAIGIVGNVTLNGALNLTNSSSTNKASTITVYGNSKLTNNGTITGDDTGTVTFETETEIPGSTSTGKTGQVVNNGTVTYAAQAYSSTSGEYGKGWWTGEDANTDDGE